MINDTFKEDGEVLIELPELSVMLGLIGKIFYRRPERAFYEQLFSENVFNEMPAELDNDNFKSGCVLLNKCNTMPENFDSVDNDYNYLFLGISVPKAPPWQSMHGPEPLMWQPSVLKVREWYKKYNLQIERKYKEPDDHVGLMLIFAAYLADMAEKNGDAAIIKDFNDYCHSQILNWVPKWCDLVTQNAKTDFFKGMALLTKGILQFL
jgi:TorA maturation chaperone TorD